MVKRRDKLKEIKEKNKREKKIDIYHLLALSYIKI